MLFEPYRLGRLELRNRVVMAPLTRSRSLGNIPGELVATYYTQRASAGLIVSEGTSPSPNGLGYARIPGLYSSAQIDGWRGVTDAVHREGGRIFVQLMHTGRMSHAANLPSSPVARARVLAPSAIAAPGTVHSDALGEQPFTVPQAMTTGDIEATVEEYAAASANAIQAGFDGVELHGANGYLIDQFLNVASNARTDAWGGSIEGRMRFALAVVDAAAARIGADRIGIRVSPYGAAGGMRPDDATDALYVGLARELSSRGIVYMHLVDHSSLGAPKPKPELFQELRRTFRGAIILAGGFDATGAEAALRDGRGDLIAFGRPFISNPDLPAKLQSGATLRAPDRTTFYTPGEKGYTDYPIG